MPLQLFVFLLSTFPCYWTKETIFFPYWFLYSINSLFQKETFIKLQSSTLCKLIFSQIPHNYQQCTVLFLISILLSLSISSKPGNDFSVPRPRNPQHENAAKFFFNSNVFTRAYLTMFYKPTLFYYMHFI